MTPARSALVIGGGIAGPAAAMALQKAGVDAVIYEARPDRAESIGVFLTLASNGIDALRVLGVDRPALAAGFSTPEITLRNATGKCLGTARTGQTLADGTTSQTVKRVDLYAALHEHALARGIRIEHGKRLIDADDTGDGVRAIFADGSEAFGDVLIGCDGINSAVRRIIDPAAPAPTYAGLLNTGGYASGVNVKSEPGGYEMIFGRHAFFGYALAPDGDVWWFANVPCPDEPSGLEIKSTGSAETRQRLLDLFGEDAGPAVALIQATPKIMAMSPIRSIAHLPTWRRGAMIVIGDASHAPSPTSGQGASLSIEDALVLAECLRDLPTSQRAFEQFETARRPRVQRIIKAAARINSSKAAGPVARIFRDAMLPVVLKLTADGKAHRETFDHHIDWDAPTRVAA